jgi:multicomponent Na+:H+ antiporter subunit F
MIEFLAYERVFMILQILTAIIFFSMILLIFRALEGATVMDRVLAMNSFGTKTVLAIILIGLIKEDKNYIDIALIYTLINFITIAGFLKFFEAKSFD